MFTFQIITGTLFSDSFSSTLWSTSRPSLEQARALLRLPTSTHMIERQLRTFKQISGDSRHRCQKLEPFFTWNQVALLVGLPEKCHMKSTGFVSVFLGYGFLAALFLSSMGYCWLHGSWWTCQARLHWKVVWNRNGDGHRFLNLLQPREPLSPAKRPSGAKGDPLKKTIGEGQGRGSLRETNPAWLA